MTYAYVAKTDIIELLKKVKEALLQENFRKIENLSDHIIHSATILQDEYTTTLSVTVYALGKILSKPKLIQNRKKWNDFKTNVLKIINELIALVEEEDWENYLVKIRQLSETIETLDEDYSNYVGLLLRSAKIKKGSKMVEHGISKGKVAELLGISLWELSTYAGSRSKRFPISPKRKSVSKRLSFLRKILRYKKESADK